MGRFGDGGGDSDGDDTDGVCVCVCVCVGPSHSLAVENFPFILPVCFISLSPFSLSDKFDLLADLTFLT